MSDVNVAEVLDYTMHKMKSVILSAKRNPDKSQSEVKTLEACLELYLEKTIHISWISGDPYMSLHEASGLDEEGLKEKFSQLINGV
jgi:hypothetical protein